MDLQAPISLSVRRHPMHVLVPGSMLQTLMHGDVTSGSGWVSVMTCSPNLPTLRLASALAYGPSLAIVAP